MNCPVCGKKLKIVDSRPYGDYLRIRVYKCPECNFTTTTSETLEVDTAKEI